ncbi:MAG: lipopolysaccharide heptosyltransferase II [Lentisphaeria bacterium]
MMKILIIKPSSLGDIVHCFPAVKLLQENIPNVHLTWVANDSLAEIVKLMPGISRIISFPRKAIGSWNLHAAQRFYHELRTESYDLALDFQGLLRSAAIAFLSRSNRRIGFADAREGAPFFYHQKIELPKNLHHAVDKNIWLVKKALNLSENLPVPIPKLQTAAAQQAAEGLLPTAPKDTPWIAVGFSSRWPSKNWPVDFFVEVLRHAKAKMPALHCWLLGSPAEKIQGNKIAEALSPDWCCNLAGKSSMLSLAGLLAQSKALLTNDSGPMHIAAALQLPCIAFFGATDPNLTGPYGSNLHTIIRSQCPLSPCFKRNCPQLKNHVKCSDSVAPEDVANKLIAAIKKNTSNNNFIF